MKASTLILVLCFFAFPLQWAFAQDITGSKDHPLVTRYPGAVIKYYEEQKYISYNVATGPETGYRHIEEWVKPEGKLTRIYYSIKGQTTLTEVYRNYLTGLEKGGFTVLAKGVEEGRNVKKTVGGRSHLGTAFAGNPFPPSAGIELLNGSATSGGSCYIAAHLDKPGKSVYIVVGGSQYTTDEKVFMVDILEETQMEDDLIKVDADAMLSSIKSDGKVAIYGIFFDYDKWEVKGESKSTLDEVAKLLAKNPSLKLYVVGHTDMKGTLDYNITLSKKRADAVVDKLVKEYGISAQRLGAQGVGPLAPISSNQNDDGRKLNRRVELVEQ